MAQCTDLPHTDCTCTVCQRPFERARSEQTTQSSRSSESNSSRMDTTTTSTPATPIPVGQRVQMITCLCFVNTLTLRARHHCVCKDVPGEAQSLDDRSSFPKGKYSPSESESANNTCNTSSRYNFLLAICRFSLTIYSHAMN